MSHLEEDGSLPNLLNDFFERRFQVIKGGVHCFVFGFAFPDHSAHVQRTDEGLGIVVLSNFDPPSALAGTSPKCDKFIFG